jgi:hypothetical protein
MHNCDLDVRVIGTLQGRTAELSKIPAHGKDSL